MKKLLLAFVVFLAVSCVTPVVNQVELYGVVEDITYYNKHHHVKVWCKQKEKYYEIVTDRMYQIGDTIKIK